MERTRTAGTRAGGGPPWGLVLKEAPKDQAPPPAAEAETRPARTEEPEAVLACAHCGHPITRERHRTTVGGRHVHTRVNPHGFVFHFGCFSAAEGCVVYGPPSQEETWFPGHAWEVAGCARCQTHLGWRFRGEDVFFGLILDRLRAG